MIATIAFLVAAAQAPAIAPPGNLAFDCALGDFEATVAGKPSETRKLAILSTYEEGKGAVREAYDPTGLLNGSTFSTLALNANPKNKDSYQFVLRSASGAARPAILTVAPNGEPKAATAKGDFVGVFGFQGQARPSHIGKCAIVGGGQAEELFIKRSPKATEQ